MEKKVRLIARKIRYFRPCLINSHLLQDTPTTGKGKHIVFGSDDDEEEEDEQHTPSEITVSKTTLFSESEEETTSDEESAEKSNKDKVSSGLKKQRSVRLWH